MQVSNITITDEGIITDYTGSAEYIIIHETIDDKTVTGIGANAFKKDDNQSVALKSVTLPNTVRSIGANAFRDNALTSVSIEGNSQLVTIGGSAFSNNNLSSITFPTSAYSNVQWEDNQATPGTYQPGTGTFSNFTLAYELKTTSGKLPQIISFDSLEHKALGSANFRLYANSTSGLAISYSSSNNLVAKIVGGDSVQIVGVGATDIKALQSGSATYEADSITRTLIVGEVITGNITMDMESSTIIAYTGSAEYIIIPETIDGVAVTSIGADVFKNKGLKSVSIPSRVTTIEANAFRDNDLTTLTIPNTVTSIGTGAFANNALTSVSIPNGVTGIEAGTFQDNALTSVILPTSITRIGDSAFQSNALASVTLPTSITRIGASAFQDNNLTRVTLPSRVANIGASAFQDNDLTSVSIPNRVTSIGDDAFRANALTSVSIGSSSQLVTIGSGAFYENSSSNSAGGIAFDENNS